LCKNHVLDDTLIHKINDHTRIKMINWIDDCARTNVDTMDRWRNQMDKEIVWCHTQIKASDDENFTKSIKWTKQYAWQMKQSRICQTKHFLHFSYDKWSIILGSISKLNTYIFKNVIYEFIEIYLNINYFNV